MDLTLDVFTNVNTVATVIVMEGLIAVLSGMYPAIFMSRLEPIKSLRGTFRNSPGGILLRRVLVVAQFSVSVALIVVTLVMWTQVDFMTTRDMGIEKIGSNLFGHDRILCHAYPSLGLICRLCDSLWLSTNRLGRLRNQRQSP